MEVKDILRDVDGKIAYYECVGFFKDMSKVSDIGYFSQIMKTKDELKSRIEEGLISLVSKKELEDFEIAFLDKYHEYLGYVLEQDVREYYNNKYCSYLYSNAWDSLSSTDNTDEVKFINGKSLSQIDNLLVDKHNELMERMGKGEELGVSDRKFLEESFLSMAYGSIVYKEIDGEKDLMYDITDYFTKYPIRDISNPRNRQLSILSSLSNRMIQIPSNCAIKFTSDTVVDGRGGRVLGCFGIVRDSGVPCIQINGLDIYELQTEKEFLEKMFTLFHELGHFRQQVEFNEFTDEVKKIILMENDMVETHRSFYEEYHDSFLIERDADNYATIQIIKEYGEQYPQIVNNIVARKQGRKRLDSSDFYLMELEEYGKGNLNKGRGNC